MSSRIHTLALAAGAVLLLDGCEHPIAIVTPHVEVADGVERGGAGALVARTRDNRRWEGGPLSAVEGRATSFRIELLDFQGRPVTGVEGRADVELRLEVEHDGRMLWEPLRGRGVLHGLAAGATRVRFLVWHETHADLVTPWLAADVRGADTR